MSLLRNLLTVVGVLAVIVIALLIWRGDKLYPELFSKPAAQPQPVPTGKVYATLLSNRDNLVEDKSSGPDALDFASVKLLEAQQTGFPPRNIPYLAVINKDKDQVKYWKLSKDVRKVSLRNTTPALFGVDVKQTATIPGTPYQVEIWVPREGDLNLEFELGPAGERPRT